jgi:hypothetical protein
MTDSTRSGHEGDERAARPETIAELAFTLLRN